MKKFKKIYIEITNICNLKCSFCNKHNRVKKEMSLEEFDIVLNKIKPYTDYIYLHVMGEPLLHSNINELINIANKFFFVNITTNGVLIDKIKFNKNIRQINISLHSQNNKLNYLNDVFESVDELVKNNTIINYRLWVKSNDKFISKIKDYYKTTLESKKIKNNIYIDYDNEFVWPNLCNEYYSEIGTCRALKDHIGILSDGTVVPCCMDSNGIVKLGNIFNDEMEDILNNKRFNYMLDGFNNNKKVENLCKHCNFY